MDPRDASASKKEKYLDGRLPADNCRPLTIVREARSVDDIHFMVMMVIMFNSDDGNYVQ